MKGTRYSVIKALIETRTFSSALRAGVVAIALAMLPVSQAGAEPLNILLLVADDLGWNDLPYFSPPIDWAKQPTTWGAAEDTARRVWPEHNRFAGRAYACRDGTAAGCSAAGDAARFYYGPSTGQYYDVDAADLYSSFRAPLSGQNPPSPPSSYDINMTKTLLELGLQTDDCRVTAPNGGVFCTEGLRRADILPGFGGLKRLADEGVVFPRFYANSTKCSPSRSALFSGRYPPRTGVTGNFADLKSPEITIAEFLKQGCDNNGGANTDPKELWCRTHGEPNSGSFPCPCYVSSSPAAECSARACYRTGLIGKWHLGGTGMTAPWNQGFDEYIGFSGGSRDYWSTADLACSPVPNYCAGTNDAALDDHKVCQSNADCLGQADDNTCRARGLYVGTESSSAAASGQSTDNPCDTLRAGTESSCCVPPNNPRSRGDYPVYAHFAEDWQEEDPQTLEESLGRDHVSTNLRPCSANGLAEDTNCAYSTRIERDLARNFIVRNAQFQPWFLTVTFHAPHFASRAPLRTEDHYKTEISTTGNVVQPKSPNSATKYWAIMEELDAAVGKILDLLDETGVCENDVTKPCSGETCDAGYECIKLGRDAQDQPCYGDPEDGCRSLADRTLVLFHSDHGRPHRGSNYGNPDLRGGKGDLFEGGMRIGLLARHPSAPTHLCSHDGTPCDPQASSPCGTGNQCAAIATTHRTQSGVTASIVDLFPTIAEAAGYGDVLDGEGHIDLNVCSAGSRHGCTTNADCTTGEGVCEPLVIDGKSFLRAMVDVSEPTVTADWREFVYANYKGDGKAIVAGDQWQPDPAPSVCAYAATSGSRTVLGSSCETCTEPNGCNTGKWCKLPGRVCVPDSGEAPQCNGQNGQPPTTAKARCLTYAFNQANDTYALYPCKGGDNECPGSLKCKADVYIACNRCEQDPVWKVKAPKSATNANAAKDLYELRTNPTEEDALNCLNRGPDASYAVSSQLVNTGSAGKLGPWQTCMDVPEGGCATPY